MTLRLDCLPALATILCYEIEMKKMEGTGKISCRTFHEGLESVCPDVRVVLPPFQAVLSELFSMNYAKVRVHLGAADLPDQLSHEVYLI